VDPFLRCPATVLTPAPRPPATAPAGEIKTFHVQGNVYMLVGAGANIAVQIGDDGVLVVDTGTAQMKEKVLAAIRQLSTKPVRWIVNTHPTWITPAAMKRFRRQA